MGVGKYRLNRLNGLDCGFLPHRGRGTIRRMVEGANVKEHLRDAGSRRLCPHHPSAARCGPPPPVGEE